MKKLLSIVVPCYNEECTIPIFFAEVEKIVTSFLKNKVDIEYVFIDDGSTDKTLSILVGLCRAYPEVRYLSLSRNFGKEGSILAGMEHASGDYIVIMDADLQDPPELLPEMLDSLLIEGYDSAATRRITRQGEPRLRSLFARLFYKIMNKISKIKMVDGARDFRMMTRQVAEEIISLREYNRFSKGITQWVGFKTKWFEYDNIERTAGKTKWSFWQLFLYSIEGLLAFSVAPLAIAAVLGIVFCIIAFIFICIIIVKTLIYGDPATGWPSLIVTVLFVGGIQLFCIGIVGQYLSKTYLETKKRPAYIIRSTDEKNKNHISTK